MKHVTLRLTAILLTVMLLLPTLALMISATEETVYVVKEDFESYAVGDTVKSGGGFHSTVAGGKFTVASDPAGSGGKVMHFCGEDLIETWDCRINASFHYETAPRIVLSYDLYVPAATTGSMQVNAHTSSAYLDICEIFFKEAGKDGYVGAKNATVSFTGRTSFSRDAWHTLTWTLTLATGEITMLVDNTVAFIATLRNKTNMTFNYLAFARTYAGTEGDLYADNFRIYAGEENGTYLVRADLEEYAAGDTVLAQNGLGYRADGAFGKGKVIATADPEDPSNTVMKIPTGDLIENWNVGTATFPTSALSYEREPVLVMEHRLYIPSQTTGSLQLNSRRSNPSGSYLDLYEIDYSVAERDATVRLKDKSPTPSYIGERRLQRERWYTLTLSIDQVTGAYTLLIDGNVALEGKFSLTPTNLECYYFARPYAGSVGDIYVDDVCIYRGYEKGTYATPKYLVNADMEHYDYGETINYGGGHTGLTNSVYDADYLIATEDPKNPSNRVMQVQADRSNDLSNNNTYEPLMTPAADDYLTRPRLVLEHDLYLPKDTTGSMQVNAWRKYVYTDAVNESTKFYDLYEIWFGTACEDATLSLKGTASATYDGGVHLTRDAWHTLTYSVDQGTGAFTLLVDGVIAYCGSLGATKLNIATYYFGTTYSDAAHPTRTGVYYVDNVHIYEGSEAGIVREDFETAGTGVTRPESAETKHEEGNTYVSLPLSEERVGASFLLSNAPYTYETTQFLLLQMRVKLSADAAGHIAGYLGKDVLYVIDLASGHVGAAVNAVTGGTLAKDAWSEVSVVLTLASGEYTVYVDGIGAFSSRVTGDVSMEAGDAWTLAQLLASDAYAGEISLDDVTVRPFEEAARTEIKTDPAKIFNYVDVTVDGKTVRSGVPSVLLPEDRFTASAPVYFDADAYEGMLSTETVASIRLKSESGIRFATRVDAERLDELLAARGDSLADVSYSTLITPKSYLDAVNGVFTKEALDALQTSSGINYLDVRAGTYISEGVVDSDPLTTHFVGSIVNLKKTNYAREFAAIGYVEITLQSGEVIALYSDCYHRVSVRTMARVMIQSHTDYFNTLSEEHQAIVKAFAGVPAEVENATAEEYFVFNKITSGEYAGTYSVRTAEGKTLPATVVLPATYRSCAVSVIEADAFAGRQELVSITLPEELCEIADGAFADCTRLFEVVNNSSLEILAGRSAHGGVAAYARLVGTGASHITEREGYLFATLDGAQYLLGYTGDMRALTLPDGTYAIYRSAFANASALEGVTLGEGVTAIGKDAFRNCPALSTLVLPDSVTVIGDGAFAGCTGLVSVTLGAGVECIGTDAFLGCYKLSEVINRSALTVLAGDEEYGFIAANALTVHTGESLVSREGDLLILRDTNANWVLSYLGTDTVIKLPTAIDGEAYQIRAYAFYGNSSVESVILGAGVNNIGVSAFDGCDALLTVWYEGDAASWEALPIGDGNGALNAATVYFYSDTEPTTNGNYWRYLNGVPTVW